MAVLRMEWGIWVGLALFSWAYFDLTASALLSPPGLTPVFVRLYNLMHYNHSAGLSAMVITAVIVPVLAGGCAWMIYLLWMKRMTRGCSAMAGR